MILNEIKEIPRLPQVSMELIRVAFTEEPDIQEIGSIVERDPTLTAKLFKTVNSAAFGLRSEVKSVSQAISIMGLDALKSTVVSLALGEYFLNDSFGNSFDAKSFCTHSFATAIIMQRTAEALNLKNNDQIYLLGLLHDLGVFAMDSLKEPDYRQVIASIDDGCEQEEAEVQVFGADNRRVWKALARAWEFPSDIVSLLDGSRKDETAKVIENLITDSSRLADTLGYGFMASALPKSPDQQDIFSSLEQNLVQEIGESVNNQVGALASVLELPVPEGSQINRSLLKVTHQLSKANAEILTNRRELQLRVTVLEELAKVFTGIIKTLDGNTRAFSFSVLENLMEGFQGDGSVLFFADNKGGYIGYSLRCDEGGAPDVSEVYLEKGKVPKFLEPCLEQSAPLKIESSAGLTESMEPFLGDVNLAWFTQVPIRGKKAAGFLGIGVRDRENLKYHSEDFGKIFNIVGGEIALSVENARLYKQILKEARFDALTGIINRRTVMKVLGTEFARYKRKNYPLAVAIFDMDHFKSINDTRGHLAGDDYLKKIAKLLQDGVRESDYIGRYGGDEFIGIFPDTEAKDGHIIVERIRKSLVEFCSEFGGPDLGAELSVSVGIAGAMEHLTTGEELIKLADAALYKAKEGGRNQCVIYCDSMPAPAC